MNKILIIIGLLVSSLLFAQTNYYVSNTGSDAANGLTPSTAWQTLGFMDNHTFTAGDSIFLDKGSVFREYFNITESGNRSAQITYTSYGSGDKPKIYGSTQITSWTNTSGNIWTANQNITTDPISIDYGAQIFFNAVGDSISEWGFHRTYESGNANLVAEFEWSWNSGTVYIYSPTDPNTRYVDVEAPQLEHSINLAGNEYITLNDLELRYIVSAGIYESYGNIGLNGLRVTNCAISNIGTKGGSKAFGLSVTSSNAYYAHNVMHDCGRRAISINLYATTPVGRMHNVIIEHNYFYNGWHTTGTDCINSGNHTIDSVVIRNNYVQGDPSIILGVEPNDNSNGFYISNQTSDTGIVSNIYIYNNILTYAHGKSIALGGIDTAVVAFNTLYGFNNTLPNGQSLISAGERDNSKIVLKNNILYNNGVNATNSALNSFFMTRNANSTVEIDYNVYWNTDAAQHVLEFYESGSYDDEYLMSEWVDYLSEKSPYDANSPTPTNPLFIDPPSDLHLQPTSVAIDAGTPISWITTDYYGKPRDMTTPTIGAIEYGDIDSTLNDIKVFSIPNQITSTINAVNHTVAVTIPYGTDRSNLTPSISLDFGATINPTSGTARDFTSNVNYTTTALKGNTQVWVITITNVAPSTDNDILTFTISNQATNTVINLTTHTVYIEMPPLTDRSNLIPNISVSTGATIVPISGASQDFTNDVMYNVTAENGAVQAWTITVITQIYDPEYLLDKYGVFLKDGNDNFLIN